MGAPHSAYSRAAAAGTLVLATIQLELGLSGDVGPSYVRVLLLSLCLATTAAAVSLLRDNSFDARLASVGLAVATVLGTGLDTVVGRPGGGGHLPLPDTLVALVLSASVALLVGLDRRHHQLPRPVARPPYAL